MRRWRRCFTSLIAVLLAGSSPLRGDTEAAKMVALGKWTTDGHRQVLDVSLIDSLSEKQRNMIEGGFTTVSLLRLQWPKDALGGAGELPQLVPNLECSVKFDAWEETYGVVRLDQGPTVSTLKKLSDYGDLCFRVRITDGEVLEKLSGRGGTITATLIVKQTSAEEAQHIKEWLVEQQSGVMQGLFSHMLGDLSLDQTTVVQISVPPRPTTTGGNEPRGGEPRKVDEKKG